MIDYDQDRIDDICLNDWVVEEEELFERLSDQIDFYNQLNYAK